MADCSAPPYMTFQLFDEGSPVSVNVVMEVATGLPKEAEGMTPLGG